MPENNFSTLFPQKQIKPYDGMSITADVWNQAHQEHRQSLSAHISSLHGTGIIAGLNVIANDPAGQVVFVSPGVAIDPAGHMLIVPETISFEFGEFAEGIYYLLLGYHEREIGEQNTEPCYVQHDFILAARPNLPKRPVIELARVVISHNQRVVKNAANPAHPGKNELDLRYRPQIQLAEQPILRVAVCYLGRSHEDVIRGWDFLAQAVRKECQIIIDNEVAFTEKLSEYNLVFICCNGDFYADTATVQAIQHCISAKTPLLIESLNEASDTAATNLLSQFGKKLTAVQESHTLLQAPNLFTQLPNGSRGNNLQIAPGLIYSTAGHSLAWRGIGSSRSDIRDAHDFGLNLVYHLTQNKSHA